MFGRFNKYPSKSDSLLNPMSDSSDSLELESTVLIIYSITRLFFKPHATSQLHVLFSHLQIHVQNLVQLSQHLWIGTGETDSASFVNDCSRLLRRQVCTLTYVFISGEIFLLPRECLYFISFRLTFCLLSQFLVYNLPGCLRVHSA